MNGEYMNLETTKKLALLKKIKEIIYNDKISGIEAKIMIKDLFEKEK